MSPMTLYGHRNYTSTSAAALLFKAFRIAGCFSVVVLLVSTRVGGRTAIDSHVRVEGLRDFCLGGSLHCTSIVNDIMIKINFKSLLPILLLAAGILRAVKAVDPYGKYRPVPLCQSKLSVPHPTSSYCYVFCFADPDAAQTTQRFITVCGPSSVSSKIPNVQELRSSLLQGGNQYQENAHGTPEGRSSTWHHCEHQGYS